MAVTWYGGNDLRGLSSDEKPSAPEGTTFFEIDTGNVFIRYSSAWVGVDPSFSMGGCPPCFLYKDADEIYIPAGRYYQVGHRIDGQYQDLARKNFYWDVAAQFAVDIDAAYSAGSTSGMVGGDVVSSCYSVFMVDTDEIMILPFIRVDTIAYSDPNTTITPAAHADGTTAANGFVNAADCFNGYRLVLIVTDPTKNGTTFTIADSTDGTPDGILITGDVTATIAATNSLQMIPPAGTQFCYLGSVVLDSEGNILSFTRTGWHTHYNAIQTVTGTGATSPRNDDLGRVIPPVAKKVSLSFHDATAAQGSNVLIASGASGSTSDYYGMYNHYGGSSYAGNIQVSPPHDYVLTQISTIRNQIRSYVNGANVAASTCNILIYGWDE